MNRRRKELNENRSSLIENISIERRVFLNEFCPDSLIEKRTTDNRLTMERNHLWVPNITAFDFR